jgi:hypothetical protein
MMKPAMKLEQARSIASEVIVGRARYGVQYSSQFPKYDLEEALAVLEAGIEGIQKAAKEELVKANRQYAALNARYSKLRGVKSDEPEAG